MNDLKILHGLPPELKGQLAEIYYEAFGAKIGILLKPKEKALELLRSALNTDWGFYAVKDGILVGFLGYEIKGRYYSDFNFIVLSRVFGFVKSVFISLVFRLAASPTIKEGQIMVDTFAVKGQMRGKGVGTALFANFFKFAKRKGFREVILEVIDTNRKAFKLYKRLGFRVIKIRKYYFLTRQLGFSASLTMLREL